MTTKEVIEAMRKGAVLCMEHNEDGKTYWLEPRRIIVRSDVARNVISFPGIKKGGDKLFKDAVDQTWSYPK
jgi:hypothetical protein